MTDEIAGNISITEKECYATLYYRGPLSAQEIYSHSGMNLEEELESLVNRGMLSVSCGEYDVSDPNLSPNQLGVL